MLTAARPELVRVLAAVPLEGRSRLVTMGWGEGASGSAPCLSDPERDLRRAIGGPITVSLVDLELDPERWHGRFITTIGAITWQRGPIGPLSLGAGVDRSQPGAARATAQQAPAQRHPRPRHRHAVRRSRATLRPPATPRRARRLRSGPNLRRAAIRSVREARAPLTRPAGKA
jgi:hypothetical protein